MPPPQTDTPLTGRMATAKAELPVLLFDHAAGWESWLAQNHDTSRGVWLQLAKKKSGRKSVTYVEAVEAALCYGWIDGQAKGLDEEFSLQRFTPRGRKSIWSKINVGRADALLEAGRMRPAGQAAIDEAKSDGRWAAAYDPPSTAKVPPDLQAALDAAPRAAEFFATLGSSSRYSILFRLQTARREETRARRIRQFVEMLERGETL